MGTNRPVHGHALFGVPSLIHYSTWPACPLKQLYFEAWLIDFSSATLISLLEFQAWLAWIGLLC